MVTDQHRTTGEQIKHSTYVYSVQLLHTILHRTDLIIFPLVLQTITIASMMSIWGNGGNGMTNCSWTFTVTRIWYLCDAPYAVSHVSVTRKLEMFGRFRCVDSDTDGWTRQLSWRLSDLDTRHLGTAQILNSSTLTLKLATCKRATSPVDTYMSPADRWILSFMPSSVDTKHVYTYIYTEPHRDI